MKHYLPSIAKEYLILQIRVKLSNSIITHFDIL